MLVCTVYRLDRTVYSIHTAVYYTQQYITQLNQYDSMNYIVLL